jgi:hypothetical protein
MFFYLLRSLDYTAEHFLLRLLPSLRPIGTIRASQASFFRRSVLGPLYRLSRLAILKDFHKHGFSRELVLALHEWVVANSRSRGQQTVTVFCHSQIPVKSFYAR